MTNKLLFDVEAPPAPGQLTESERRQAAEAKARATDPESSHIAAERMNESGAANRQRERVVDLVFQYPGLTSKELAQKCEDLDRYQLARRLPEAEQAGQVERRAGKGRSKEVTWWPRD